jgi:hypothetical protein
MPFSFCEYWAGAHEDMVQLDVHANQCNSVSTVSAW